jgi:catechol 2,3-dioxygenase-like lactoylglutathione lyase family enzyme
VTIRDSRSWPKPTERAARLPRPNITQRGEIPEENLFVAVAYTVFSVKGAFFALSVADMEASVKWYSEKLDLKVVMREPKKNKSAVTVLAGGGLMVELLQDDDAIPSGKEAHLLHGIFKVGVIVDDLDKTLSVLNASKVPIAFGPYPPTEHAAANIIVADNAGNLIQFFGKYPRRHNEDVAARSWSRLKSI